MLIMEHITNPVSHVLCGNVSKLSGVTSEKRHISVYEAELGRDNLRDCFHMCENLTLVLLNTISLAKRDADILFTCK